MTFRLVIRDVRSGKLLSVRSEHPDTCEGLEAGDEILEAVPLTYVEGRTLTAEECAKEPRSLDGFELIGCYELPHWVDARPALNPLSIAPWAN